MLQAILVRPFCLRFTSEGGTPLVRCLRLPRRVDRIRRRTVIGSDAIIVNAWASFALVAMAGLASLVLECPPVHAHDWYPSECCAQNDCMRAKAIETDSGGRMTVIVGDRRIAIPRRYAPRTSPDGRIHVCFRMDPNEFDGSEIITLVCLFLPAQV